MGGKGKPVHFISFLGIGEYQPTIYHLESGTKRRASSRRFVQEALLEILDLEDYVVTDVSLLLTTRARSISYEKYERTDRCTGVKSLDPWGLEDSLQPLQAKMGFDLHDLSISDAMTTPDQWGIFNAILDTVQEGSALVVDVTHGFRTTPIIFILALDFLKKVRNCTVEHIWYGNWEARTDKHKDEQGESCSPVVDLTSMAEILDWSAALQNLLASGNAAELGRLMSRPAAPDGPVAEPSVVAFGEKLTQTAEVINRVSSWQIPRHATHLHQLRANLPADDDINERPHLKAVTEVLESIGKRYDALSMTQPLPARIDDDTALAMMEWLRWRIHDRDPNPQKKVLPKPAKERQVDFEITLTDLLAPPIPDLENAPEGWTSATLLSFLMAQIGAAQMLLKHSQYMQAHTLLREAIVTLRHWHLLRTTPPERPKERSRAQAQRLLQSFECSVVDATSEAAITFLFGGGSVEASGEPIRSGASLNMARNALDHAFTVEKDHGLFDTETILQAELGDLYVQLATLAVVQALADPCPTP